MAHLVALGPADPAIQDQTPAREIIYFEKMANSLSGAI